MPLKITLVGSRYFGAAVLDKLAALDVQVLQVVAPAADDRLAHRAQALGLPLRLQHDPKHVPAAEIADGTELIVCAHTHARIDSDALAKARLGGIGYHPSLLPRHRGIAAVEWTIKCGDAIAGGSIYHLAQRMDAGAIAAQDWCFVKPGETARELWERALAPLGIRLLTEVVAKAS
ncbi:MAG TPA: formyltransferase family protein, partial [Burkholderiaceae bacterium]|nr:formyltransferase family protein [Burkholderiaceae bacterium]